jgi:ATP-dependent helicase HepA
MNWAGRPRQRGDHQVLVADDTAEDGLNLQVADAVVHLRLPWSPNQLEQRLGRVDRYPAAATADSSSPAPQFLIGSGEGDECFTEAWARLLTDGYQIFSGSVSTLQDAIASGLDSTWVNGFKFGPTGLIEDSTRVRADLAAARQEIDKMDMLESIYETSAEGRDIAAALMRFERDWRTARDTLLRYTSDDSGGIKLDHYNRTVDGCRREIFDLRQSRPLLPPRQWKDAQRRVSSAMAQGAFNRSAALRAPGTRLLRRGNPLVDALAETIAVDDRGQASALQRTDPHYEGGPEPYFGFDYLVEADIAQALKLVAGRPDAARALRRQADRILPPFTLQVWIGPGSDRPLADPARLVWLGRPYDKRNGDRNYGRERGSELIGIFGGRDRFRKAAETSEAACRKHLAEVTDLERKCAQAQHQARQRIVVTSAQARARQAAGHLVGDAESYVLDVAVADALVEGLSSPRIRPVAVTCVIRTQGERIRRDV